MNLSVNPLFTGVSPRDHNRSRGPDGRYLPNPGPDDCLQDVSLVELIARPEKFDGKRARFIGFLTILFEGTAIYLPSP